MAEWLPTFMWALDGNSYSCAFESVAPAQLHIPNENNNFQNRTSVRRVAGIFCCLKALRLSCFGVTWWSFVLWGSSWLTTLHTWKGRASLRNYPYLCLIALWAFLWVGGLYWCGKGQPAVSSTIPRLYEKVPCLPPNNRVLWPFPF